MDRVVLGWTLIAGIAASSILLILHFSRPSRAHRRSFAGSGRSRRARARARRAEPDVLRTDS